ncbi:mucin-2-like isoform X2 [Sebastes umbrosus]|nr:mucin-2-like isoform X2 [Sebastes umbrosus]
MTSPKTRYLLPLAAFLFPSIIPTVTEVVKSVSDCDQFLLEETPPQVPGILEGGRILNQNRYKPICQTFDNERRFVTLYDTQNKIPVFSAYKYRGGLGGRPRNNWKIEPQLEEDDDKNMVVGDRNKTTYDHQAGDSDYRHNGVFDRGHLFPSSHAFNISDKRSTFTLTNIVPQARKFNQGSWSRMEKCIKCVMDKYCDNNNGVTEGFVVTGAQPSTDNVLKNRINIPSMLWSAFCCYSSNMSTWLASAHWGDNVPPKEKHLQTKTLEELHQELRITGSGFKVFPGTQCPLHSTVTQLYPQINNCNCPPSITPTSTSGPLPTTSGSSQSTSGPLNPTSGPPQSSSGSPTSTSGPLPTTSGPSPSSSNPTSTSVPPQSSSGPLTSTSVHPTSTSGYPTSTSAPLTSTSVPSHSTSGPLNPTSDPPQSTSGPLNPTSVPPQSTSGPPIPTSGPPQSTSGPLTSTSGPTPSSSTSTSTSVPPQSSSGPLTSTSGPPIPTSVPPQSSSGPLTSTSGPLTSTFGPPTSTSGHPTSTSAPLISTSGPPQSTSIPSPSTSGPPQYTAVPSTSTSGPPQYTSGPLTPTSVPLTSTSGSSQFAPLTSTSGPPTSTSVPPQSTSGLLSSTSLPSN